MGEIIRLKRSIVPSCDMGDMHRFIELMRQTHDVPGIGGYKIGSALAVGYSLPKLVDVARKFTDLPLVYDHQKWMTDVPGMGLAFINNVKASGIDALVGFPLSGQATQREYIALAKEKGLELVVGGEMTAPEFKRSDGGYIADEALASMYTFSANMGINNFFVPGTKVDRIAFYNRLLQSEVQTQVSFWSTGFVAQGGIVADAARAAGESFHATVGRAIYEAKDMQAAAANLASQLTRQDA
jgi:orotidine-5'-phosphate decarboxylase